MDYYDVYLPLCLLHNTTDEIKVQWCLFSNDEQSVTYEEKNSDFGNIPDLRNNKKIFK